MALKKNNLTVLLQECAGIDYPQAFANQGFIQGLSTLDLLMNCPEETGDLIRGQCHWREV